jgi:peptidoglycan/LPS O-acetylase OafA/YrhL
MVFFVMSGFVLARSCQRHEGSRDFGVHIAKRVVRLGVPVAGAVMVVGCLFHAGAMRNQQAAAVSQSSWLASFYTPGPRPGLLWSAAGGSLICGSDWWMGPLWSIHVQLFGALLIFALMALIGLDRKATLVFVTVIVWSLLAGSSRFGLHFAAFVSGALLLHQLNSRTERQVVRRRDWITRVSAVVSIVYFGSWPDEQVVGRWYQPVAGLFGFMDNYLRPRSIAHTGAAVLIVWGVVNTRSLHRTFTLRPLQVAGQLSFGVYLIHWPILMSVGAITFTKTATANSSLFLGAAAATVVTFVLSAIAARGFQAVARRATRFVERGLARFWAEFPTLGSMAASPTALVVGNPALKEPLVKAE